MCVCVSMQHAGPNMEPSGVEVIAMSSRVRSVGRALASEPTTT